LLKCGFNDNVGIFRRPSKRFTCSNAIRYGAIDAEKIANVAEPLRQLFSRCRDRILHAHLVPGRGKQVSDTVAHQTGADHCDARFAHATQPAVKPPSTYMICPVQKSEAGESR